MIEKAESKDNSVFAIHCHVAAISDSRYSKDSKVKAYWDLCGDYHTRVCGLFNREDSKLSWVLTACHLPSRFVKKSILRTGPRIPNSWTLHTLRYWEDIQPNF
jgi:hypothetical protein